MHQARICLLIISALLILNCISPA
jgi:hypothetical protein